MSRIRKTAEVTICVAEGVEAVPKLCQALHHRKEEIRWAAAWALGEIRDAEAVPDLLAALYDPDWLVKRNAIRALGKIGHKRAVQRLCEILGDRDPRLRAEAAETLGILGDERGITPLRECLGDEGDPDLPKFGGQRVCDIAAEALRRIGTEAATLAVEAWDVPPMEPRYELGYFLWGE